MHKLMKALASKSVTVHNATSGEISLHYPEIAENNYPTGVILRLGIPSGQVLNLTDSIPIRALKLSQNLKPLVRARHLLVVLE